MDFGKRRIVQKVVAGEERDRDLAQARVLSHVPKEVDAVHRGHPYVDQEGVGRVRQGLLEAAFAALHGRYTVPPELEHPRQRPADGRVVVNN